MAGEKVSITGIITIVAQLIWVDVPTEFWLWCQIIFSK